MIFSSLIGAVMFFTAPTPSMPVTEPFVHDPVMAYEDGIYYLYCTGMGIAQMTSRDLKTWTVNRDGVLEGRQPVWTYDSVPGLQHHLWAPDVIHYNNKWYMAYSCSTFGSNTSAIGLLSNGKLSDESGWKDEGCIIASKGGRDNWNAIDPNFVIDENGNPWMTWGNRSGRVSSLFLSTRPCMSSQVPSLGPSRAVSRLICEMFLSRKADQRKSCPDITTRMRDRMR